MKKNQRNKVAQTIIAYVIFLVVLIAAFSAIAAKLRQKTQQTYKESADAFGEGRQFGAFSTSGGVAEKFKFPILPLNPADVIGPPGPINPDCDAATLAGLQADALAKQQNASSLSQQAADAAVAAAQAHLAAEQAREAARIARDEANQARQDATDARSAADDARRQCSECKTDCQSICDQADQLEQAATEKEEIATQKETIATEKEADFQTKQNEAVRLDGVASGIQAQADAASQDAQEAAQRLQDANEACYGGGTGGTGGSGCFLKGTRIALADGTNKPIEEIKIGDMVLGYDGKEVKASKVIKTFLHPKTKGYRIISTEEGQKINVTDVHPLFNGKNYIVASKFKVGYTLFVLKDNKLKAVKIKSIEIKDNINDVYNLKVDKLHNYFAEGVLCHNKPPSNSPEL